MRSTKQNLTGRNKMKNDRNSSGNFKSVIPLKANQRMSLWSNKGYYNYFIAGSVVSSAIEYNDDPIASVKQQQSMGYPLHYLIPECKIMSANPQPIKKVDHRIEIGQVVYFQGKHFEIVEQNNNNLGLKEIKSENKS